MFLISYHDFFGITWETWSAKYSTSINNISLYFESYYIEYNRDGKCWSLYNIESDFKLLVENIDLTFLLMIATDIIKNKIN